MGKVINSANNIASSFITSYDFSDKSKNYYKDALQDNININWDYASDIYTIEEEVNFGTMIFTPVEVRIVHAVNSVTGKNLMDDWKQIIFKDINHKRAIGTRYKFGFEPYEESTSENQQIWINTNLETYKTPTASATVRRCNNNIKFLINNNTEIHSEPCIIEQGVTATNVLYNDILNMLQSTITITVQNNIYTSTIQENDRFIIGNSKVYKVKTIIDFMSSYTMKNDGAPTIQLILQIDTKAPSDNFVYGVTNYDKYNPIDINSSGYDIVIIPEELSVLQGREKEFSCYLYNNGVKTSNSITFSIPSDDEYFQSEIIDGNTFSIKNIKKTSNLISISCESLGFTKTFEIQLRGLY